MRDRERLARALACVSDGFVTSLADFGQIEVIGRSSIAGKLDAGGGKIAVEQRAEIIKAVNAKEHVQLLVSARTFRQKLGAPNTRYLRHREDHLPSLASSYKGMPFLLDYRSWDQEARMGTIVESDLHDHGGTGWKSFDQRLHVVKPNAVISVLDGTIDRFSIGWHRNGGDVLCTLHGTSIFGRAACACWPGDKLAAGDGKEHTVEWEFQSARGTETSAVNSPAVVVGTGIKEVRAALCEELGLTDRDFRPDNKETQMDFTRLAALLGLTTLSSDVDVERACSAIENIKRERLASEQELATTKTKLADTTKENGELKTKLATANDSVLKIGVDAVLETAYREGKLRHGRDDDGKPTASGKEARLRRIASEDGIEALRAELAEMDVVVPVGQRVLTEKTPEPKRSRSTREATPAERHEPELALGEGNNDVLDEVALQLGLEKDMPRFSNEET
jgi:hypothetical protein